jgi:serine phosphatase RsbU (regulator of sigma subunit)
VSSDDLPGLDAPQRLDVLARTGLSAAADPTFDRFAAMVRNVLDVPVALVSLVDDRQQFFPGACGLADPWAQQRRTPLSHSFCQHVVLTAEPLVITDARLDPRLRTNLAIADLGVIGYAGMPLTDADGVVLGSLCAIDTEPHEWTPRELELLADLAAACSDSLRLRIATGQAERGATFARAESRQTGAAFDRSQLLLRAAGVLAAAGTVDEVIEAVRKLVVGTLDPAYVGLSMVDVGDAVTLSTGEALPAAVAARWASYDRNASTPSALAVATGAPVLLPDLSAVQRITPDAAATFADLDWQSAASTPLPGPGGPLGALTFVWRQPNTLDDAEQAVLVALAGYVAQALLRATAYDDRRTAAATLQKALLTDLPSHHRVRMAARYLPAHHADDVGGDWYDAVAIDDHRLALVIGDLTGHNIRAAADMSQLRSMLRTLLVDRQESPSAVLRRLEQTSRLLGITSIASVVLAYLDQAADGTYTLTWANAGHPPPLLRHPDGRIDTLTSADPIVGALRHAARHDNTVELPPASTLLFYTDGLVETRRQDIDHGISALSGLLRADRDPEQTADVLLSSRKTFEDDVALLVVKLPPRALAVTDGRDGR